MNTGAVNPLKGGIDSYYDMGSQAARLTIALYVAVSRKSESRERNRLRQPRRLLRRLLVQFVDILGMFFRSTVVFHFHHWSNQSSNKGDIAIREEVRRRLIDIFPEYDIEFLEYGWGELDESAVVTINSRAQLFMIAGSGYIFPRDGVLPQRLIDDAQQIQRISIPKVAYAIGWNSLIGEDAPLDSKSKAVADTLMRNLNLISVRDRLAQKSLHDACGIMPTVIADPVLFHASQPGNLAHSSKRKPSRMGINIALHGPFSAANVVRDIDKFAALLKAIRRKYRLKLQLISHSSSDRIVWWLLLARGVYIRWRSVGASQLSSVYSNLDFHLGQMMHSTIYAMGAGVPTIAIGYDRKLKGFFDLMECPDHLFDVTDWEPEQIESAVERLIAREIAIREKLEIVKTHLWSDEKEFLRAIRSLILRTYPTRNVNEYRSRTSVSSVN